MTEINDLSRFIQAQKDSYDTAFNEISSGRKSGHWMWYIFPQLRGLGFTDTSKYYAIKDLKEAQAYLTHPVLGQRLIEISQLLLKLDTSDANRIFGTPDDLKLRSSMTLFSLAEPSYLVFQQVLNKFFDGKGDEKTFGLLNKA